MKQESSRGSAKQIEANHKKNQTSIFDFIKYTCDQNDVDIDQSKNQLYTQNKLKENGNVITAEKHKQGLNNNYKKMNSQLPSQPYAETPKNQQNSYCGENGDHFSRMSTKQISSISKTIESLYERVKEIIQMEYLNKEDLQPYWRSRFLLFIALSFLIIGNVIHLSNSEDAATQNTNIRIILIVILITLLGFSFLLHHSQHYKHPHNSTSVFNCAFFSENQVYKKLMIQIILIVIFLFMFILYAKSISNEIQDFNCNQTDNNNSSSSSSNSSNTCGNNSNNRSVNNQVNSQSITVQLIEAALLYQYTSTFFLSFYILRVTFLLSILLIYLFFLGLDSSLIVYYYAIAFIIQICYLFETFQSVIDSASYLHKFKYISSTSFPTEMRQHHSKSPYFQPSPGMHKNIQENRRKFSNQLQISDTLKLYTTINPRVSMREYQNDEKFQYQPNRGSSAEAINQVLVNSAEQNDNNLFKLTPEFQQRKKLIQKKLQAEIYDHPTVTLVPRKVNMEETEEFRNSKKLSAFGSGEVTTSSKVKTLTNKRISEHAREQSSQKIKSLQTYKRISDLMSGEQSQSNKTNRSNIKNGKKRESVTEGTKNLEIQLEDVNELKVCHSEPSKDNIISQYDLQKSSSSSQTNSPQNQNMIKSSEFSPVNRMQRNFSLFRRLQEQIQIEEKTSQEEGETFVNSPLFPHNENIELFTLQRSNSLGKNTQRSIQRRVTNYQDNRSRSQTSHQRQNYLQEHLKNQHLFNQQKNQSSFMPINNGLADNKFHLEQDTQQSNAKKSIPNQIFYSFTDKSQDDDRSSKHFEKQFSGMDETQAQLSDPYQKIKLKQQFYNRNKQASIEYQRDMLNGYSLMPLGFQRTYTGSYSLAANMQQKTKLYKNILKYLPEEGVILIDKNHTIHFTNLYVQQLFPKSNINSLFGELVQLKSIDTLENYKQYMNEIIDQKHQEQNDVKARNLSQNLTRVQLTYSINMNNQEQNHQQQLNQQQQQQMQNQVSQLLATQPITQQKQYSKTSLRNINAQQSNTSQNMNPKTQKETTTNSNFMQSQQYQTTFTQFQQQNSHVHVGSNHNIPIGGFAPYTVSSASINPTQKLSQSNYFAKLDLFRQAKENKQLKENIIRCKSFLEQFEQIIENFRQLSVSYKQYGIASQNKFTTLLYRPYNYQKQESIEDVQIFEVQFIPCYLGYTEGVVVTIRDVTHFNQIKVLKDINERKSNMLRNVSHELRQPLNCIISMMQLTRDSYTDQTLVQEYINPTLYSCQILLNLLNDFLDFSQIQAGTFKLTNVFFNLKRLFLNIFQMMKAQIQIRSLNFVLNVLNENDIPEEILSDPNRIQQIITNLLGNAVKFTEHGDIILSLEKQSRNIYKISVQDSGIGITEEGQKNLFKTFGKVDQDLKSNLNPQGVGLGLMISNILAKQLGPREDQGLQVESKIGCGTKFYFYLIDNNYQEKELIYQFPQAINCSRDRLSSPQNLLSNLPSVRRATSNNIETSVYFQGQHIESQEDWRCNSVQIVPSQPYNILNPKGSPRSNQIYTSTQSFENVQEHNYTQENIVLKNNNYKNLYAEVHENNIKKIDLKNQSNHFLGYSSNEQLPHKRSQNKIFSNKHLDINSEGFGSQCNEKEMIKGQNILKRKQSQQTQFITQGIVLRQQTLILQPEYSPRSQKQLIEDIMNYQKQKSQKCQCSNTKDILIVDDNDFNIYVLEKYLKTFSIETESSTNGPSSEKKTKEKIENSKCDGCRVYKIIFMDLNLGQYCGIQVANNLIAIYKQQKLPLPILIACTGLVDENTVENCLENGFNDFLSKPIVKDQLVDIIQKYLKFDH